jgi:putative oxidoreductase
MMRLLEGAQRLLDKTKSLDFIAPLAIRIYLVPVFLMAGLKKVDNFPHIVT